MQLAIVSYAGLAYWSGTTPLTRQLCKEAIAGALTVKHGHINPANLQRFQLEAESTKVDQLWQDTGNELVPAILDVGAIQFQDGSLRLGQVSRVLTDPFGKINAEDSEKWLRTNENVSPIIGKPKLPGGF